jgi:hypothetical protein
MPDTQVPREVETLAEKLAGSKPMRRGSVTERYVKCNKVGCPCRENDNARHGPYYSVSRVVNGRTRSRWLSADEAAIVRQQVQDGKQFRKHLEAYWDACERWADAELDTSKAPSEGGAKKGASKAPSQRKSSPKSKR